MHKIVLKETEELSNTALKEKIQWLDNRRRFFFFIPNLYIFLILKHVGVVSNFNLYCSIYNK